MVLPLYRCIFNLRLPLNIKTILSNFLVNLHGWQTNRKIIVFESDDWGSIRMPSKEIYESLLNNGFYVDRCPYNRNDSLASENDLEALFSSLTKFKDKFGNHPIFTANTVVANPNFEKIKKNKFSEYYYEPFTETLKKYPQHQNSFKIWQEGMNSKIFFPQFHGREHLNIKLWLKLLKEKSLLYLEGFNNSLWGFSPIMTGDRSQNIQAAFNTDDPSEIEFHKEIINDGLNLFEKIFNYRSESFIANNYTWDTRLDKTLFDSGVKILKTMKYQKQPSFYPKKERYIRRKVGEKNKHGQTYLIRNVTFEPTQMPANYDNVDMALKEISIAFALKKPAIIDSHRLNYIGYINERNRARNLMLFEKLVSKILKKWPDVEFMNTSQLFALMNDSNIGSTN